MGALALVRNPVHHARTKHIDIRHHYVRELVSAGALEVTYVPTELMEADLLTKGLPATKFKELCMRIGLRSHLSGSVENMHLTTERGKMTSPGGAGSR
jgi:hypothetical protein